MARVSSARYRTAISAQQTQIIRAKTGHPKSAELDGFVEDRSTYHGCKFRTLNVFEKFTREGLTTLVRHNLKAVNLIALLSAPVHPALRSQLYSIRHQPGVHDHSGFGTDRRSEGGDGLHRAVPPGERDLRELQLEASKWRLKKRDLLHIGKGEGGPRELAQALQHGASPLFTGMRATCSTGRNGSLPAGDPTNPELTSHLDHPTRTGQARIRQRAKTPPSKLKDVLL